MERYGRGSTHEGMQSEPASEWTGAGVKTGLKEPMKHLGLGDDSGSDGGESYPERPYAADCVFYLRTGHCRYGAQCRFNHPCDHSAVVGALRPDRGEYPERAGQPLCQYYMRYGMCKFGASCKYHHPNPGGGSQVSLNYFGYPLRPGEKECTYYMKTGLCKFGVTCKFHHPQPGIQVPALRVAPARGMHSTVQSPSAPSSQQDGAVAGNWQIGRPLPVLPGSSSPVLLSPGMVPIVPYAGSVNPVVSPGTQPTVGTGFYGMTQLSSSTPAYTGMHPLIPSSAGPSSFSQKEHAYPERPGRPECQFYMKTGECKFGSSCRFHHPQELITPKTSVVPSLMNLPPRPLPFINPSNNQLNLADLEHLKVIGKGTGGFVQLVWHKWTGKLFALKVIQTSHEESARKRIAQELKITQLSQCPYVVVCYQSFYENGAISTILEYMNGGSFADFLKKVGAIPEPYLAAICKQVLLGLLYLHHEKHIIHRDLKPSNLLMNHLGEVKINDFGVSAILGSLSGRANSFVGTYNYMSPERIIGVEYSYKSDIWSLGLIFLECATGRFPYILPEGGEEWVNIYELMEAIVEQPPPSAPSNQFSPEFCSFISACLQKEPKDRQSAHELMSHPFINMYDDLDVDLASYFSIAGSPHETGKETTEDKEMRLSKNAETSISPSVDWSIPNFEFQKYETAEGKMTQRSGTEAQAVSNYSLEGSMTPALSDESEAESEMRPTLLVSKSSPVCEVVPASSIKYVASPCLKENDDTLIFDQAETELRGQTEGGPVLPTST